MCGLTEYHKRIIFSPIPASIRMRLDVKSQFVSAVFSELMQQLVADPVVAVTPVESALELFPRAIEEV